jgi:FkbM family methyltransferase
MNVPSTRLAKRLIRSGLRRRGVEVVRSSHVPFGWYPTWDIAALVPQLDVVFDVGANSGQTVRMIRGRFPDARIWCFEPVPTTFAALAAAVADLPTVYPVQRALGDKQGTASITAVDRAMQNRFVSDGHQGAPTVDVQVDTVDRLMEEYGVQVIDLLKIDTEGHEVEVLTGARAALCEGRVRLILAECDFTPRPAEPHTPFGQIIDLLYPLGYRVVTFYTGGVDHEGWRWGDCLFMRSSDTASTPFRVGPVGVPLG